MSSSEVAALKEQGNALYLQKRYTEAVRVYTQALELDPTNHVLYSNWCARSLRKEGDLTATTGALRDAIKRTELQPWWAKGFFRLGAAREKLGQRPEVCICMCVLAYGGIGWLARFWGQLYVLHIHETLDQVSPCIHYQILTTTSTSRFYTGIGCVRASRRSRTIASRHNKVYYRAARTWGDDGT